jgi:hypothetical protein
VSLEIPPDDGRTLPFRGQISVASLRRATRAASTPSKKTAIWLGITGSLLLWGLVIFPLTHGGFREADGSPSIFPVAPLFFVVVFAAVLLYSLYAGPKKALGSNKLLQSPMWGEVTERGVLIETERSRAELSWDLFLRARISSEVVLLYQSIQVYSLFPREHFASDADWATFVGRVRRHVPDRAPRSGPNLPVRLMLWLAIFVAVILLWNAFSR